MADIDISDEIFPRQSIPCEREKAQPLPPGPGQMAGIHLRLCTGNRLNSLSQIQIKQHATLKSLLCLGLTSPGFGSKFSNSAGLATPS